MPGRRPLATQVGSYATSDRAAFRGRSVLSCRPSGVRRKLSLSKRANLPCQLTQPQCKGLGIVGCDTEPSHWATIVSPCAVESVCREFDIETYELAGARSIVDIDVKAAGIVHVTMLPHSGSLPVMACVLIWHPFVSSHCCDPGFRLGYGGLGKWLVRRADVRG